MTVLFAALPIGVVAGLRAMTVSPVVGWAARLGVLPLHGTAPAFPGGRFASWLLPLTALGERVADPLPATPSRKLPLPFGGRRVVGGGCAAAVVAAVGRHPWPGIPAGVAGAPLGSAAGRARLATGFENDHPAADSVAIGGGIAILAPLP